MANKIIIPDYITHIEVSKSRRKKYFKKGQTRPKKYEHLTEFDKKGRLLDEDGEPVTANPRVAGTPRLLKINGQALYSSQNPFTRSKMVSQMKEFFQPEVAKLQKPIEYPITVVFTFGYTDNSSKPDVDNLWIYRKTILDAMTAAGIIPDDSPEYVNGCFDKYKLTQERQLTIRIIDEAERKRSQRHLLPIKSGKLQPDSK